MYDFITFFKGLVKLESESCGNFFTDKSSWLKNQLAIFYAFRFKCQGKGSGSNNDYHGELKKRWELLNL